MDKDVNEFLSSSELRNASFPQKRRGYDPDAVHEFLDRIADWVESRTEGLDAPPSELTSEIAKVGERTAGILTAAEEAAAKVRREAKEHGDELRSSAEDEARKMKLNASQKADELIAEAEAKAETILDEAISRRRRLNQAVASLVERREEIAEETQGLADKLLEAVEAVRADEPIDDEEDAAVEGDPEPEASSEDGDEAGWDEAAWEAERSRLQRAGFTVAGQPPGGEPTELEAPDERETTIHETR